MRNNTRKLTLLALTVSFALILSFIEARIPAFTSIPGIKVGLANIAVIFALYKFGFKEAAAISVVRVLLVSMLFGNPVSLIYSFTGAVLSLTVMFILKKLTPLSEVTVSVTGGVMHNIGQIGAASVMLGTNVVVYYLPFLLLSGTIAGVVVGIAAGLLIKKVKLDVKDGKTRQKINTDGSNTESASKSAQSDLTGITAYDESSKADETSLASDKETNEAISDIADETNEEEK